MKNKKPDHKHMAGLFFHIVSRKRVVNAEWTKNQIRLWLCLQTRK